MTRAVVVGLLALMGCSHVAGVPVVAPTAALRVQPAKRPRVTNRLVVNLTGPDTLESTVAWTAPVSDGKGGPDSMKVNINRLATGGGTLSVKLLAPYPTSMVFRQGIPFADATWNITGQVCTYRGTGVNASNCVSATAPPFVYTMAPPPPVTNVSVTNVLRTP